MGIDWQNLSFLILFLFRTLFFELGLEVTDQGILGLGGMDPFKPLHLSRRGCKIVIDLDTIPLMEGEQGSFVPVSYTHLTLPTT